MRHEFDLNHHFTITNYYYFSTTRRITDHQIQSTTTTNWSNYLPERLYSLKLKIWCFDLTLQSRRVKTEIVEFENWMDAASLDRGWTSIFNRWSSYIQKLKVWYEKKVHLDLWAYSTNIFFNKSDELAQCNGKNQ